MQTGTSSKASAKKVRFLKEIEDKSFARHTSMNGTAGRSNYALVALAFVFAGGIAVLVVPTTSKASQVLLTIGCCMLLVATGILLIAMLAKLKVFKKPRPGGESEADEMLRWRVAHINDDGTEDLEKYLIDRRDRAFTRLNKRKVVLVVERRAQTVAAYIAVSGLSVIIVALCLR